MQEEDKKPTPEEIRKAEEDLMNDPRMVWGGLILRVLWAGVILWWLIKSCKN